MNPYEIKMPANDKEGLRNALKKVYNQIESGNRREAMLQLIAVIDDLAPDRVHFEWMSTRARKASAKQQARGIAAYALANPAMVD